MQKENNKIGKFRDAKGLLAKQHHLLKISAHLLPDNLLQLKILASQLLFDPPQLKISASQ